MPGIGVLPLDDARLLEEAKPIRVGKVQADPEKVKQREQALVKNVLDRGNFGLVVLGASHDLSALVPPGCEYIRVWVCHLPK